MNGLSGWKCIRLCAYTHTSLYVCDFSGTTFKNFLGSPCAPPETSRPFTLPSHVYLPSHRLMVPSEITSAHFDRLISKLSSAVPSSRKPSHHIPGLTDNPGKQREGEPPWRVTPDSGQFGRWHLKPISSSFGEIKELWMAESHKRPGWQSWRSSAWFGGKNVGHTWKKDLCGSQRMVKFK